MTKIGMLRGVIPIPRKKKATPWYKPLDTMFSLHVRHIAGNVCEYCGKSGRMECHHGVVHRRYMNTRFEIDNCACLCGGCHRYLGDFSNINTEFFKKKIGTKRYEELEIIARSQEKMTKERREDIRVSLKERIKELS